jgi:exosome complex component RRP4
MLRFASYKPPHYHNKQSGTKHHPDVAADVMMMDEEYSDELLLSKSRTTCPGETLASSQAYMRGHGTFVDGEDVVASVAGTIERVNKLITVKAIRTRYNAEIGDLIVGRITEVQPKRWKVDANARQDAILMLSSVNLPGGVQAGLVFKTLSMRDTDRFHRLASKT